MATATRRTAPAKPARPVTSPAKKAATGKARPVQKTVPAKSGAIAATPIPLKEVKAKKPKLVRDSFTMPKDEYAVLNELKLRAAKLARPAKKSELLRAGTKALMAMSDTALSLL